MRARSRRACACRRKAGAAARLRSRRARREPAPSRTCGIAWSRGMPRRRSGRNTLSSALAQGSSVASWNTKPISPGVGCWPASQSGARVRLVQPGDQPQQRRFAAARRPEQRDEIAGADRRAIRRAAPPPRRKAAADRGAAAYQWQEKHADTLLLQSPSRRACRRTAACRLSSTSSPFG